MPETFPRPPIPESGQPPEQFEPGRAIWAAPPTTSEVVTGSAETEVTVDSARSAVKDAFGPDTVVVSSVEGEEQSEFDELGYQQSDSGNATGTSVPRAGRLKKWISKVKKEQKTEDSTNTASTEVPKLAAELRKVASEKRKEAAELRKVASEKRRLAEEASRRVEIERRLADRANITAEKAREAVDEKQAIVEHLERLRELKNHPSRTIPRGQDKEGNTTVGFDEAFARRLLEEFETIEEYNKLAKDKEHGGDGSYRKHDYENYRSMIFLSGRLHRDYTTEDQYYSLDGGEIDHKLAEKFTKASNKLSGIMMDQDKKYDLGPGGRLLSLGDAPKKKPDEPGATPEDSAKSIQFPEDLIEKANEAQYEADKAKKVADDAKKVADEVLANAQRLAEEAVRVADEAQYEADKAKEEAVESKKAKKQKPEVRE